MMKLVKKLIASSKAEAGTVGTWMELERTSEMESGMMVVGLQSSSSLKMDGLNEDIRSREHGEAIGVVTSKAEIGMLGTGIGHDMSEIGSGMVVVWWSASALLMDGLVNNRDVERCEHDETLE